MFIFKLMNPLQWDFIPKHPWDCIPKKPTILWQSKKSIFQGLVLAVATTVRLWALHVCVYT